MRASWASDLAASAPGIGAALLLAVLLTACVPIPGSTINACVFCNHSGVSTPVGAPEDIPAEAPTALPAIPASILSAGSNTPKASPVEAVTAGTGTTALPPVSPHPAPASSVAEPTPAAPGAGVGQGVVPTAAAAVTEPLPGLADPLAERLRKAEGLSLTPYPDTGGVIHICYGHRVTLGTCDSLLEQDKADAAAAAERVVGEPTWSGLTQRRRWVLSELAYMTGPTGLSRFTEMLKALHASDYAAAADEINLSTLKPPTRAVHLANVMREG